MPKNYAAAGGACACTPTASF